MSFDGPAGPEGLPLCVRWEKGEVVEARPATAPDSETIVLPGLVCGHLESGLALLPGHPRGDARKLLDAHDEASLLASARVAALDAAHEGVTLVFDSWRGKMIDGVLDLLDAAFAEVGVRFVGSVEADDARDPQAAVRENLRFHEKTGRALMGVGQVSASLPELVTKARRAEMSMHVVLGREWRALAEKGALRPESIALVQHDLDEEEQAILRDLAIWTVALPGAAVPRLLAGRTLPGGTTALLPSPLARLARGWDAASAILGAPFGRFALGAPADFVLCDAPLVAPLAPASMPAQLERLESRHIREVICAGEPILRDRRPTRVDERELRAKAREQLKKLWARAA